LKQLQKNRSVGPNQDTGFRWVTTSGMRSRRPSEDGGRTIVIATDRPIGFWEASHRPRSFDYPFTVIEMKLESGRKRLWHDVVCDQNRGP